MCCGLAFCVRVISIWNASMNAIRIHMCGWLYSLVVHDMKCACVCICVSLRWLCYALCFARLRALRYPIYDWHSTQCAERTNVVHTQYAAQYHHHHHHQPKASRSSKRSAQTYKYVRRANSFGLVAIAGDGFNELPITDMCVFANVARYSILCVSDCSRQRGVGEHIVLYMFPQSTLLRIP